MVEIKVKEKTNKYEIIRGRMPKPVVLLIKAELAKGAKIAELAEKYRTTYGKINDIAKERCFKNVTADNITEDDMVKFDEWIKKHDDKKLASEIKKLVNVKKNSSTTKK